MREEVIEFGIPCNECYCCEETLSGCFCRYNGKECPKDGSCYKLCNTDMREGE